MFQICQKTIIIADISPLILMITIIHTLKVKVMSLSHVQLFCDPMDCSLPGSSVHGIFQARVLEWLVISFSRGSSQPRDRTLLSCIAGRCFTIWATRETCSHFDITQTRVVSHTNFIYELSTAFKDFQTSRRDGLKESLWGREQSCLISSHISWSLINCPQGLILPLDCLS